MTQMPKQAPLPLMPMAAAAVKARAPGVGTGVTTSSPKGFQTVTCVCAAPKVSDTSGKLTLNVKLWNAKPKVSR